MKKSVFLVLIFISIFLTGCENKKSGVVLSGGGAKGAYEIGCLKAMEEYKISKNIISVSGTSVGALNAALFACTDLTSAENLWMKEVCYESFLHADENSLSNFGNAALNSIASEISKMDQLEYDEDDPYALIEGISRGAWGLIKGIGQGLISYFTGDEHAEGLFSREPLKEIIKNYVSLEKIKAGKKDVYVTCLEKNYLVNQYLNSNEPGDMASTFLLNQQTNDENISDLLLASSALPGIYPSQLLKTSVIKNGVPLEKDAEYIDGGIESIGGDNTPVKPLLADERLATVFIVYLDSDVQIKNIQSSKKIIHIVPSEDLGNLINGTINFDQEKITDLINLGYADTCKILEANGYKKSEKFVNKIFSLIQK